MMRKFKLYLVLALFPLLSFGSVPCGNVDSNNSNLKKIVDRGYIKIATIADNPPFYWESHGIKQGYDYDIMKNLSAILGVELRVIVLPRESGSASIVRLVKNNKADVAMANLIINQKDAQHVFFSNPYVKENMVLLVNRKKMHVNNWQQSQKYFASKKLSIAVVGGSIQESMSGRLYPKATPVKFASYIQALRGVVDGKSGIMMAEIERIWYLLARNPELVDKVVIIKGDRVERVGFVVNYASLRLQQWLNFYISIGNASKLGFLKKIHQEYFHSGGVDEST